MEERAHLVGIEHDHKITKETDGRFLFEYQRAVLLALKDSGTLDEVQYRYAEGKLTDQFRTSVRARDSLGGRGAEP